VFSTGPSGPVVVPPYGAVEVTVSVKEQRLDPLTAYA
jgi:hypothetical protein